MSDRPCLSGIIRREFLFLFLCFFFFPFPLWFVRYGGVALLGWDGMLGRLGGSEKG